MFSMADPCDFILKNQSELISKECTLWIGLKITSTISLTSQQANTEPANIALTFVFCVVIRVGVVTLKMYLVKHYSLLLRDVAHYSYILLTEKSNELHITRYSEGCN